MIDMRDERICVGMRDDTMDVQMRDDTMNQWIMMKSESIYLFIHASMN